MITLWRLYRQAHGPGLAGAGGLMTPGRWHLQGSPVVYFGASAAIVVLEKLVHIDPGLLPADLMLGRFEGELGVEELLEGEVEDLHDLVQTRARGEKFLKDRNACALRVPSVVVPEETNLIFNPLHPDAGKLELKSERRFAFDGRLL